MHVINLITAAIWFNACILINLAESINLLIKLNYSIQLI